MKRNKKIIVLAGLLLGIGFAFCIRKIYLVNQKYPQTTQVSFQLNETVSGENVKFQIESAEFWDLDELQKIDSEFEPEEFAINTQCKILVVGVRFLEAKSELQMKVARDQMILQAETWANGWDLELYCMLNDTSKPLEVNELIYLPYGLFENQFRTKEWKQVEEREFEIVTAVYPQRRSIKLGKVAHQKPDIVEFVRKPEENTEVSSTSHLDTEDVQPEQIITAGLETGTEVEALANHFRIESVEFMDAEEIRQQYPEYELEIAEWDIKEKEAMPLSDSQIKVIMVGVRWLQSDSYKNMQKIRSHIEICHGEFSTGWDKGLYLLLNDIDQTEGVIYLPFFITDLNFSPEDWDQREQLKYEIQIAIYPNM